MQFRPYVQRLAATLFLASLISPGVQNTEDYNTFLQPNNKKYALVILASDDTPGSFRAADRAYTALLFNSFQPADIYVMGVDKKQRLSYPADFETRKDGVETVFNYLRSKIRENDTFVLFITGHGYIDKGKNEFQINLSRSNVTDADFQKYLNAIRSRNMIIVTDTCFSGALAQKTGGKIMSVASSKPQETAYDDEHDVIGDNFGNRFFEAFHNLTEADTNQDKQVSIEEAFNYASRKHRESRILKQHPIIVSDKDPGEVFLSGSVLPQK